MKCLLCSFESKDQKILVDHHLNYHHIDSKNWFFQKLFQSDNKPLYQLSGVNNFKRLVNKKQSMIF